jgi:hypothetical protein
MTTGAGCDGPNDGDSDGQQDRTQLLTGHYRVSYNPPAPDPPEPNEGELQGGPLDSLPATLEVRDVLAFQQLRGNPAWQGSQLDRVRNSVWQFADDGTVAYQTSNVRTDLFPLRGTYEVGGSTVSLSAQGSSQVGATGAAFAQTVGSLDISADPPRMQFGLAFGNSNAAVINGTEFGGGASSAYTATVTLTAR